MMLQTATPAAAPPCFEGLGAEPTLRCTRDQMATDVESVVDRSMPRGTSGPMRFFGLNRAHLSSVTAVLIRMRMHHGRTGKSRRGSSSFLPADLRGEQYEGCESQAGVSTPPAFRDRA
jgi:hypothetical protein